MSYEVDERVTEYAARRVELVTNAHFEALAAAFESAVPELTDAAALDRLAEDGDWQAFTRRLAWESPSGFVRVWSSRPGELMNAAGSGRPSGVWLIVNHAIGARLFRHDPATVLYSPVRVEAHAAAGAGTVLAFDVPGARLRSFGTNKVTQAGAELDRALGDLVEDLGLPRPVALRR
ncbi:hypothetical protein [Gryllotalpicola protaetiae]|uniref:DUF302 domain-containing protein n=1 Tax=Gryllotalpicola protaetiae TaxID=2419771 RepID=A0A387BVB3_9MICO|nr:hypothetical protein [Gryllotalpicola protaetiae]AYG05050.1 hypothetical protein D7I44_17010 [Gryllotalpicola protaetiae]